MDGHNGQPRPKEYIVNPPAEPALRGLWDRAIRELEAKQGHSLARRGEGITGPAAALRDLVGKYHRLLRLDRISVGDARREVSAEPPDQRDAIEGAFDEAGRRYRRHRDPLKPWQAYRIARLTGRPIPTWVLEYFDATAGSIVEQQAALRHSRSRRVRAEVVSGVFGFTGRAFQRARNAREQESLALEVAFLVFGPQQLQVTAAIATVAEHHGGPSKSKTVERAWRTSSWRRAAQEASPQN
jgi:hypothetical protein